MARLFVQAGSPSVRASSPSAQAKAAAAQEKISFVSDYRGNHWSSAPSSVDTVRLPKELCTRKKGKAFNYLSLIIRVKLKIVRTKRNCCVLRAHIGGDTL
jgi:hypothetical protein